MDDVQFEEEKRSNADEQAFLVREKRPDSFLGGLILKTGIVKSEPAANLVLLVIACAFFAGAVYLYTRIILPSKVIPPIKTEDLSPEFKAKFPGLKTF